MTSTMSWDVPPPHMRWPWMIGWAAASLLLALVAFYLPEIEWMAKGGVVGWLLFSAGLAECAFAAGIPQPRLRATALAAGLFTAAAGLIFVINPLASYFPVVNLVMIWLAVRGIWMLARTVPWHRWRSTMWLGVSGVTDLLLAFLLLAGLPIAALVVTLFGPTPEIIAQFSWILAVSFLATGISQLAVALTNRSKAERSPA